MPYRSMAQVRAMHVKAPGVAKRWDRKYGVPEGLPERVQRKKKQRRKVRRHGS